MENHATLQLHFVELKKAPERRINARMTLYITRHLLAYFSCNCRIDLVIVRTALRSVKNFVTLDQVVLQRAAIRLFWRKPILDQLNIFSGMTFSFHLFSGCSVKSVLRWYYVRVVAHAGYGCNLFGVAMTDSGVLFIWYRSRRRPSRNMAPPSLRRANTSEERCSIRSGADRARKKQSAIRQPEPPRQSQGPIRVSAGVQSARLVRKLIPEYPPLAKAARISGVVHLIGIIARDGTIRNLQLVSGHPLLAHAAMEAVEQWVYRPTLLNGEPVEVIAPIDVYFTLGQ
jgi:TonB family protein